MQRESLKNTGPTCDDTETCEPSPKDRQMIGESMSSAEDSLVRTLAMLEREQEYKASAADFGARLSELFALLDRDSSSWRTSQRSILEGWIPFVGTWPKSGLMRNGKCFQLRRSVLHSAVELDCFLWPTPRKCSAMAARITSNAVENANQRFPNLETVAALQYGTEAIGQIINPAFCEWLMGFPIGWTDLVASETPSSPKSPNGSDDAS